MPNLEDLSTEKCAWAHTPHQRPSVTSESEWDRAADGVRAVQHARQRNAEFRGEILSTEKFSGGGFLEAVWACVHPVSDAEPRSLGFGSAST
jgi:hypothetical protein